MKISLKQLKQIIKEEVGALAPVGGPLQVVDAESLMGRVDAQIMELAQALAVEIANSQNPGGADVGEADEYLPEVENAVREAIEGVIREFV